MKVKNLFLIMVFISFLHSSMSFSQNKIQSSVIASGGTVAANETNRISGTIGQSIVGRMTGVSNNLYAGFWEQAWGIVTEIESDENRTLPGEFYLYQNYPNPFNPTTKIKWESPVSGWHIMKLFDVLGNEVAILVNEEKPAGRFEIQFDASPLSSGVYFYKIQVGSFVSTKKMILLR